MKSGFSWPGFFFTWLWAFVSRLWFVGVVLLAVNLVLGVMALGAFKGDLLICTMLSLVYCSVAGFNGNAWKSKSLEGRGYEYLCTLPAASPAAALAKLHQAGGLVPPEWRTRLPFSALSLAPARLRQLFAMAWLTLKAALRYRLVQVLTGLLLAAVVGLPAVIRHDGTAQGFTQILLTYTLGAITVLLGFATLWLGCGTLARDVEECQMQMVVVKPISRWEVWLGKWLGIMLLNALLLGVSGGAVYLLMQWRASKLSPEVQTKLRGEVMVARASMKPAVPKRWVLDFGRRANSIREQPLYIRTRFFAAQPSRSGTYAGVWEIGPPEGRRFRSEPMSLAAETFHEFRIEPNLLDRDGTLTIDFQNYNDTALLFPLEDGIEVLYRQGGFGLNFVRGLGIISCWLALLATIGLSAGSFLSFPVASFVSLAILLVGLSSGTVKQVVEEGGISAVNQNTGTVDDPAAIDRIAVPFFRGLLAVINLVQGFSPIDSLSTGRSVTWGQLSRAGAQIVLLLGGVFSAVGITTFTRRELATAQGTQ